MGGILTLRAGSLVRDLGEYMVGGLYGCPDIRICARGGGLHECHDIRVCAREIKLFTYMCIYRETFKDLKYYCWYSM